MKKLPLFTFVFFSFSCILYAQQLQEIKESYPAQFVEIIENHLGESNDIKSEPQYFMAPKPHYYGSKRWHQVSVNAGILQSELRMNKPELTEVLSKPSPLVSISLFKHKKWLSFQTGAGLSLHRFEVETISVNERELVMMLLDIPLMARCHFTPSFFVGGGYVPVFNLSTRSDFNFENGRPEEMSSKHDTVKNMISNVRFTTGYLFSSGFNIQANYTKALGDAFKEGWDDNSFGYIDLQVGYALFANRGNK